MVFADGSARVLIRPDGTFVFDRKAVAALGLKRANCISVFYSRPDERFALRPLKGGIGVALEKSQAGRMVAYRAADFLDGVGVLPAKATEYPAQFYADLNMIVVRDVTVRKRRKAA